MSALSTLESAQYPLSHIVGANGLIVDGDWVESKDQDPDGDVRLIQLADIGIGRFLDKSNRFLTSAKASELGCTFLKQGDILVARMPDPIGRACIFPGSSQPCVTVVDVCIVRPDFRQVNNRWLSWAINAPHFSRAIDKYVKGTTRQRISRTNLESISLPLPSIEDQVRIAAILDAADALRVKRRATLFKIDTLTQSIFIEMFGDPIFNSKKWPLKKLGDVGTLDRGVSKHRPRNAPDLLGGIHPLIQTGEVANCDGYIRSYKNTYSDSGLRQSKMWPAGTLCITIAANIAKSGILTFDACFPDSVVGFRAEEPATVEFVRVWLSFLQQALEDSAPESAQKNINLAILRDLRVPLPPLDLQRRFANSLRSAERLRSLHHIALKRTDLLVDSLQRSAFQGEL